MTDVAQRIAQLRQEVQSLTSRRAAAEHQQQLAQATFSSSLQVLKDEFGVDSVAAAQELLASLDGQVQQFTAAAEQYLVQAGVR